jgi:hypothetical protein
MVDDLFGPRTKAGMRAWEPFATLADTSKKLLVKFYQYIHERIFGDYQIPPLADLVTLVGKNLNLGWSSVPA